MSMNYNYQQAADDSSFNTELPSFDDLALDIEAPPTTLPADLTPAQPTTPARPAMPAQPTTPAYPIGTPAQPTTPAYPVGTPSQPLRPAYPIGTPSEPLRPAFPARPPRPPFGGPQIQPPRPPFGNNQQQISICTNRLTHVWDISGDSYWTYPTAVRNNTMYGYRYHSQAGWFPYEMPLWQVRRYVCIR